MIKHENYLGLNRHGRRLPTSGVGRQGKYRRSEVSIHGMPTAGGRGIGADPGEGRAHLHTGGFKHLHRACRGAGEALDPFTFAHGAGLAFENAVQGADVGVMGAASALVVLGRMWTRRTCRHLGQGHIL